MRWRHRYVWCQLCLSYLRPQLSPSLTGRKFHMARNTPLPSFCKSRNKSSSYSSPSLFPLVFSLIGSFLEWSGVSPCHLFWKYIEVDIEINFIRIPSWHFSKEDNTNISNFQWSCQEFSWRHINAEALFSFNTDWQGWHKSLTSSEPGLW